MMVAVVIAFPNLVTGGIGKVEQIDADKALQLMMAPEPEAAASEPTAAGSEPSQGASGPAGGENPSAAEEDPMKALEESMKKDAAKKN
jgi:hypothetical protein